MCFVTYNEGVHGLQIERIDREFLPHVLMYLSSRGLQPTMFVVNDDISCSKA